MFEKFTLHFTRYHHLSTLCSCLILLCSVTLNEGGIFIYEGNGKVDEFRYEVWPFAAPVPYFGLEGFIIKADPLDACFPISEPPVTNLSVNWFLLIDGSSCDYDTKVFHSQLAGYSAAIVYRLNETSTNSTKLKDYIPNIPAVIITEDSSIIIQENYLYSANKSIKAIIISFFPSGVIVYSGVIVLVFAGIIKVSRLVKLRCINGNNGNRWVYHRLRQMNTTYYKSGDPYETCAICLEDFKSKEKLRILSCSHGYHVKCIDPWLIRHQRICPVCKQRVCLGQERCESQDTETSPLIGNIRNSYNSL